jgi:hypothetical protein
MKMKSKAMAAKATSMAKWLANGGISENENGVAWHQ